MSRSIIWLLSPILLTAFHADLAFADWPTFRRSPTRNAVTSESLPEGQPRVLWSHEPAFRPSARLAWPAKWDAYANLRGLHSMRSYDQAFHTIHADGGVFYASSAEDCVRRLDPKNGEVLWTFFADGPVRVAPTFQAGRLYFGSDDGHAYCINAESGEEIWRYAPRADGRKVLNNGKLIPLWPVRTGVTVIDGKAYFAASLLPWETSYLCAVNAETGEEIFTREQENATFEAPLVASPRMLIAPQGRVPPLMFKRESGEGLGQLDGGGGSFVVLIDEETMMHGPGNKAGWVTESNPSSREKLATHEAARAVVNYGGVTYFVTENALVAIDYKTKKRHWRTELDEPLSLIGTSNALLVGCVDAVCAVDAQSGDLLWRQELNGRVKGLSYADSRLLASLDTGEIVALSTDLELPATSQATPRPSIHSANAPLTTAIPDKLPKESDTRVAAGPWLRFTGEDAATVDWETAEATPSRLLWRDQETTFLLTDVTPKKQHSFTVSGLRLNRQYYYRVADAKEQVTNEYECDTFFNYSPESLAPASDEVSRTMSKAATQISEACPTRGVALVLGASEAGHFAEALARNTELRIIVFDPDTARVAQARKHLESAGLYGQRVTVLQADDDKLGRVTDRIATLVTSGAAVEGGRMPYSPSEVQRLTSPNGVALLPAKPGDELDQWAITPGLPINGAGEWSHIYGSPDNSAFGGEVLDHAQKTEDLAVQWIGRPGPRYQADRNGRKAPPLSVGGRLFLQGLDRVVTVDAYNGTILWAIETPHFRRFNMPRDCGNWCADVDTVYAAARDRCWLLDAATGEMRQQWTAPSEGLSNLEQGYDWGYIARVGDLLLGTACRTGASWTNFWGGDGWYDATEGPATHKVASDRIFALDHKTGKERWSSDRLILSGTITVIDDAVCFVECRNDELNQGENRRLSGSELTENQFLVALDLKTGDELWNKPIDKEAAGEVALWLSGSAGRLVLVASANTRFDVSAYSSEDGARLWRRDAEWGKGKADHGTHLSRPAILGEQVIVRPTVLDLATGETSDTKMPVSGCGTYACSTDALFFRAWSGQEFAIWSPESGAYTRWSRLRPDCWLSTIPANGLLLSPEGGGGCSCGSWLETSLAFIPKTQLQGDNSPKKTEESE